MAFSASGLLVSSTVVQKVRNSTRVRNPKGKIRKKKPKEISSCLGFAVQIHDRAHEPNPYSYSCSLRCRHPIHSANNTKERILSASLGRNDEWTSENIYKRYTQTDSRPVTPDMPRSHRTGMVVPSITVESRKCITPEPEAKQCQFHQRRILILDLRRVKSVDAIIHQDSVTTGTSFDSTFEDDDKSSASASADSIFHHLSSRNISVSRSTTPKTRLKVRRLKKSKERSTSPIAYERSSSPKILEGLTLPPLHSSVLTLLGQRSPTKASPRTALLQGNQHPQQPSTSKHKKLRRHGRKHKNPNQSKETQPSGGESNEDALKSGDEPSNTQLSAAGQDENADDALEENGNKRFQKTKSLFQVINENLGKTSRKYYTGIENLEHMISDMSEKYVKKSILLNPAKINMKEDTWLAFPKTWSHTSATFSAPGDSGKLKSMSPLEYLQKYVTISDPRKDLYSLVFRRYRILDNPTGKTITTLTAQKALAEVMGETLSDETIHDLFACLNIDPNERELTDSEFYGICAFSERVYSKYPMESCNECYACSKYAGKDKTRCHQNQKSIIEQTDLEHLSNKLRDNRVGPSLKRLIQALCNVSIA